MAGHPLTHLVAALLVLALLQSFAVKVFQVPSASMEHTLSPGDRILVDRISFATGDPHPGDVVVFDRPASWRDGPAPERAPWRTAVGWFGDVFGFGPSNGDALVKRVIGEPGSTVACCDAGGRVTVDGTALTEDYIAADPPFEPGALDCDTEPRSMRCFGPVTLGADEYLLLGDNRADSADSVSPCRTVSATPDDAESTLASACARTVPRDALIGPVFFRLWPLDRIGAP
ncbi:signal peptidase I [Microbacterium oleivorans]|uniref:Signal peptidase I n=1 Tax=Microbacterium oleivorans TaxID=273677 RepID=A0A7D5IUS8_9MICO|nr:signal peptidase I [Microbacterium oleivorans]